MLNIIDTKNTNIIKKNIKLLNEKKTPKHFPSPTREWTNSIYVFNKNNLKLIPSITISVKKYIKSYFNLHSRRLEIRMRTKRLLRRLRRLSSNKYYISNGQFKHTNNKVIINLYVFNRQKTNYFLVLKRWYLRKFLNKSKKSLNVRLVNRLKFINNKGIEAVRLVNKDKFLLIKALNTIDENKNYKFNSFKDLSKYTEKFYKKLLRKSLKKLRMYFYYKRLIYINKSKLNYSYLQHLKKYLEMVYNKNVEFNIINLKKFYLNSDILSESIAMKLTRNRRKMFKFLNIFKNKIDIWKKKVFLGYKPLHEKLNTDLNLSLKKTLLHRKVFNDLKYKHVTGFRLEAKGRLTKRYTASRSVSKLRYKGNLLDIDSSYRGLSSVILKGNLRSNTQYTKLKSKSRIGSFGIKGWVSGN